MKTNRKSNSRKSPRSKQVKTTAQKASAAPHPRASVGDLILNETNPDVGFIASIDGDKATYINEAYGRETVNLTDDSITVIRANRVDLLRRVAGGEELDPALLTADLRGERPTAAPPTPVIDFQPPAPKFQIALPGDVVIDRKARRLGVAQEISSSNSVTYVASDQRTYTADEADCAIYSGPTFEMMRDAAKLEIKPFGATTSVGDDPANPQPLQVEPKPGMYLRDYSWSDEGTVVQVFPGNLIVYVNPEGRYQACAAHEAALDVNAPQSAGPTPPTISADPFYVLGCELIAMQDRIDDVLDQYPRCEIDSEQQAVHQALTEAGRKLEDVSRALRSEWMEGKLDKLKGPFPEDSATRQSAA